MDELIALATQAKDKAVIVGTAKTELQAANDALVVAQVAVGDKSKAFDTAHADLDATLDALIAKANELKNG